LKPVRIDFSGKRSSPPAWGIALFAIGVAIAIFALWKVNAFDLRQARANADLARVRSMETARRPPAEVLAVIPAPRIDAINAAVAQLNLPWQALFESLEKTKPQNIALLSLEPDGKKRVLRILAEAKQSDDMLDFVRILREQPQFSDALLTRHEINIQDPNRPLRFTLEATWKPSL
jgi:Tfp pilus assembly protein PilN